MVFCLNDNATLSVVRQNLTEFGQYVAECLPKYVQQVQLTAGQCSHKNKLETGLQSRLRNQFFFVEDEARDAKAEKLLDPEPKLRIKDRLRHPSERTGTDSNSA